MAEQVVMLVKYSKAMRYIQSGSGIESHLPSESLRLFLCGLPVTRIFCYEAEREHPVLLHALGSGGRQFAAWLGLVPRQHSTGGKMVLLGMTKRGNGYLR